MELFFFSFKRSNENLLEIFTSVEPMNCRIPNKYAKLGDKRILKCSFYKKAFIVFENEIVNTFITL